MIRGFGPSLAAPPLTEVARAAIGAALGLFVANLILWALGGASAGPMMTNAALIAPFGATAYLIFSVPTSPLAQPWSAVVGNTVSALAALVVLHTGLPMGLPMVPAISAAVLLATAAMALTRAMHPPGGAIAIATALLARPDHPPLWSFALLPVCIGTIALVGLGIVWNRATGRSYPFVQPQPPRIA